MNKLFVEGKDDLHIIGHLLHKYGVSCKYIPRNGTAVFEVEGVETTVRASGGISSLKADVKAEIVGGRTEALGIIVDADEDIAARWQSCKDVFEEYEYVFPRSPNINGTIVNHPDINTIYPKKVGVWLMPNNQLGGTIEDFIAFLIPNDDKLLPIAEKVLDELIDQNLHKFKSRSKALIHTWLAWQEESGTGMGEAIKKRYLDSDVEEAELFIDWLLNLFRL